MTQAGAGTAEHASALACLLEAESRLEALLDDARRDAVTLTTGAEARAVAVARAVDEELALAAGAASSRRSEAASSRLGELARDRDASLACLERHGQERAEALAAWVTSQVLQSLGTDGGIR